MNPRREFKISGIKTRIEFCEAERRHLLRMVTTAQVNLAWVSERMDSIQKDLRLLSRDLKVQDRLEFEE
jgi:hypothetical protein